MLYIAYGLAGIAILLVIYILALLIIDVIHQF